MPDLFQLPKVIPFNAGVTMPGAKLYFYQTATSTPQNTYTDAALTTPHANPVEADANGVFAPIFLDPNLPNYRVTLTDANDVTMTGYPVDDYPALSTAGSELFGVRVGTDIGSVNAISVTLTNPDVTGYDNGLIIKVLVANTNTSANVTVNINVIGTRDLLNLNGAVLRVGQIIANQYIYISYNSSASRFELISPTYSPGIEYAGTSVLDGISGGVNIIGKIQLSGVDFRQAGTFTGGITGFSTSPTIDFNYLIEDKVAYIYLLTGGTGQGGGVNNNSTTMTITGLPAILQPSFTGTVIIPAGPLTDNGAGGFFGYASITGGSSVITLHLPGVTGTNLLYSTGFTSSGVKGIDAGFILSYPLI